MHHALYVAPFGRLADPIRLEELAVLAETTGWDGVFLWDHVLRPDANEIADPWVCLAVMARATTRIRLGPMVTPLVRRRLIKLAREVLSVDLLSEGRLTLGLGLGVDSGGELSRFDERVDPIERGELLSEGAAVLAELLSGEMVSHRGKFFTVDEVTLAPRPVQHPRPPFWFAARGSAPRPVRRAAGYEGLFPIDVDADDYQRILDELVAERGSLDGFDIAVRTAPGQQLPAFAASTATWHVQAWPVRTDLDLLFDTVAAGPPG
jgi:alkanesulfonate monooxygenase SsuD/methylene tetrahydromethanopterin reductase-like flavin-dependent oxidoreductase (luciferase family)